VACSTKPGSVTGFILSLSEYHYRDRGSADVSDDERDAQQAQRPRPPLELPDRVRLLDLESTLHDGPRLDYTPWQLAREVGVSEPDNMGVPWRCSCSASSRT